MKKHVEWKKYLNIVFPVILALYPLRHIWFGVEWWDTGYNYGNFVNMNRIAHESAATDCNENDVRWLTAFHHRLLNRQDPLALLNKADRERENFYRQNTRRPQIAAEQRADNNHLQNENNSSPKPIVKVLVFVEILVIIAVAAIFIKALMAM